MLRTRRVYSDQRRKGQVKKRQMVTDRTLSWVAKRDIRACAGYKGIEGFAACGTVLQGKNHIYSYLLKLVL